MHEPRTTKPSTRASIGTLALLAKALVGYLRSREDSADARSERKREKTRQRLERAEREVDRLLQEPSVRAYVEERLRRFHGDFEPT